MSTEHQQYSTANQEDVIRDYALRFGYEINYTYPDEGKSGLRVEGRSGLKRLIADVQRRSAQFEAILVYDVSRWSRFQDADESAYYGYLCRRAGIEVHYCAEQFQNDGGPTSMIIKGVKRAMAAEYSRELSSKVRRVSGVVFDAIVSGGNATGCSTAGHSDELPKAGITLTQ